MLNSPACTGFGVSLSNSINSMGNGSSGAMRVSPSTICRRPTGPIIVSGSSRPALPMVSKSPGRPEIWSAWKWVMQITSMALNPQPSIFIVTCVPSPQSTRSILPFSLASIAVRKRLGIGIMPPVPSKQISIIAFSPLFAFILSY